MKASFLRGPKPYKLMFCTYNYTWQLKSQDLEFSIGSKFYRASMQLTELRSKTVKMAVLSNDSFYQIEDKPRLLYMF